MPSLWLGTARSEPRNGDIMTQWLGAALVIAVIALAFVAGYVLARRGSRQATPDETLADARLDAQRILARAEEEARSKAEVYRDREDATLEHRRVEISAQESRIAQREATLEQRAGNLAQREEMVLARERAAEAAVADNFKKVRRFIILYSS